MLIRWDYVLLAISLGTMQYFFAYAEHLTKPINMVSVVGTKAVIECRRNASTLPINWEFAPAGCNNFSYIYTSERMTQSLSSRYKIDTDGSTRWDIVIDSVDLSHAGTYRCEPITKEVLNAPSFSAQLIVLVSDPICKSNGTTFNGDVHVVEGDYLRLWCTISYSGNWLPVMEWNGSYDQTAASVITHNNTSITTVTTSIAMQLNSSDNGFTFTCKTSFKPTSTNTRIILRPGESCATNVPGYLHVWNFTTIVSFSGSEFPELSPVQLTPVVSKAATIALIVTGGIVVIALLASGTRRTLTNKISTTVNTTDQRPSQESWNQRHDYEEVDESNVLSGESGDPRQNQITANEGDQVQLPGDIDSSIYSSLELFPSATVARPAVYTQLHLSNNMRPADYTQLHLYNNIRPADYTQLHLYSNIIFNDSIAASSLTAIPLSQNPQLDSTAASAEQP